MRVRAIPLRPDHRCPLCREGLGADALSELAVCPGCAAVHHLGCVRELGAGTCATLGCGRELDEERVRIPHAEERGEAGRLILVQPTTFLAEMAWLWGLGLTIFLLMLLAVWLVVEVRAFPMWSLGAGSVAILAGVVALEGRRHVRRRRRKTALRTANEAKRGAAKGRKQAE